MPPWCSRSLVFVAMVTACGCDEPEATEAERPSAQVTAAPAAPPIAPSANPAPPSPETVARRAQWKERLASSRQNREDRLPTLVEALESPDDGVATLAFGEIDSEPRGVALSLLEPVVSRGKPGARRLAAALVLAKHFRAFDFPNAPMDADDRRVFAAIAKATLEAPKARAGEWLGVLATMFHTSGAGPAHEAASAAPRLFQSFLGTLDEARRARLVRLVEADDRRRVLVPVSVSE